MIDLTPLQCQTIQDILQRLVPDCEVRAFGSRVRGAAKPYSDLDLIQNLEFTYEVCWKMMKRWLETNAGENVEGVTRRELFRMAAENRLIDNVDAWMTFRELRNQTSHPQRGCYRYDSKLAEDAQTLIADFIHAAERLLNYLKAHND